MSLSTDDARVLGRLDAHAQARKVRVGDVSPVELVEAAIMRIEALNPALNAVVFEDFDRALTRARNAGGAMAGVSWLLKDGLDYPGMPTRSGSRSRKAAKPAHHSFPFTDCFDTNGLVPLGKTNVPEFALLPTTESVLYGPAINPWAPARSPGGSSGGSAVAVASGMTPIAHAADGGGSTRIPASCCGLVGLKPGRGANRRARGAHIMEDLLSCDSVFSRTVRDAAWAFAAASPGRRPAVVNARADRLRIAVVTESLWGDPAAPEVETVVLSTARLCQSLGHCVDFAVLPVDGPAVLTSFKTLWGFMARDCIAHCRPACDPAVQQAELEPWTLGLAAWSEGVEVTDTADMYLQVYQARHALEGLFQTYDCILSPVLRQPPVALGELAPTQEFGQVMRAMFDYVSYTPLHNMTGHPAISLPLFTTADGVPVGSMFASAHGGEDKLFELAFELEEAQPWRHRWPPLSIGPGQRTSLGQSANNAP